LLLHSAFHTFTTLSRIDINGEIHVGFVKGVLVFGVSEQLLPLLGRNIKVLQKLHSLAVDCWLTYLLIFSVA